MNTKQQYTEAYRLWRRLQNWKDNSQEGRIRYYCLHNQTWLYRHDILFAARKSLDMAA